MQELNFQVSGPNNTVHQVVFRKDGKNLTVLCSCATGIKDICQHKINILSGSAKDVINANKDDLKKVKTLIGDTDVGRALQNLLECSNRMENATDDFNDAKKRLVKALND